MTEPFSQWVVEDHFPAGRPDLGAAGVWLGLTLGLVSASTLLMARFWLHALPRFRPA